ncbi:MAG TPA: LLM class flavin-dependent oxidoreductase [Chloroflexota bacterium]|nr:LLM class flavin-dependent oxidoreductase [Chloroflexota bacterium]
MSRPRFGVELHEYLDAPTVLQEARQAEALGYDAVWLADSQLIWRELYVLLGAVAATTRRVALGTGVTNPVTRHPAVTAGAITTVQELSRGRALLGIGLGNTSLATLGRPPATRAALARYVATVRALCAGEPVGGTGGDLRLAFGAPERCPPVVIAGSGPRILTLAGEIGDGVIIAGRGRAGPPLAAMLRQVRAGRQASGRPARPFTTYLGVAVAVHADRATAIAAVRPHVVGSALRRPLWELSPAARAASERVQAVYSPYDHMSPTDKYAALVPDEVVTEFAIAGTPADCRAQARGLFAAGIDEITIRPYAVDGAPRGATTEAFAREVMAPLRG